MEKRKPTVPYPLRPVPLARVPPGEAFGVPERQEQARSWERRRPCPPLPLEGAAEPAFLRLRNERDKVETLRAAIGYIRDLQELLEHHARARDSPAGAAPLRRADCNSDGESKASSAPSPCSEPEDGAS
ncbi:PREDICTED: achaete-scute homolog 4 [Dipodomys ordii]|uniref:Achaete-scute homolog 4 n=1 Tax=Dipodomys ordii TaxID=10020 RepID=A0A1S3FUM6_DIPOR|nr:PREDICTED: achaete-scute homolog 4 [Dipodomys ordii]